MADDNHVVSNRWGDDQERRSMGSETVALPTIHHATSYVLAYILALTPNLSRRSAGIGEP